MRSTRDGSPTMTYANTFASISQNSRGCESIAPLFSMSSRFSTSSFGAAPSPGGLIWGSGRCGASGASCTRGAPVVGRPDPRLRTRRGDRRELHDARDGIRMVVRVHRDHESEVREADRDEAIDVEELANGLEIGHIVLNADRVGQR